MSREYCYNTELSNGHEPTAILLRHFKSDDFRTIVLSKEDFETLAPWKLCCLLQDAFEAGQADAKRQIRNVLGIEK